MLNSVAKRLMWTGLNEFTWQNVLSKFVINCFGSIGLCKWKFLLRTQQEQIKLRITNYSQQDANFLEFISTDALHVSGGFLRPSSGAHNCTYSFRYCQQNLKLYVQLRAPDNGRRKPPETCTASVEINSRKVTSFWL